MLFDINTEELAKCPQAFVDVFIVVGGLLDEAVVKNAWLLI